MRRLTQAGGHAGDSPLPAQAQRRQVRKPVRATRPLRQVRDFLGEQRKVAARDLHVHPNVRPGARLLRLAPATPSLREPAAGPREVAAIISMPAIWKPRTLANSG